MKPGDILSDSRIILPIERSITWAMLLIYANAFECFNGTNFEGFIGALTQLVKLASLLFLFLHFQRRPLHYFQTIFKLSWTSVLIAMALVSILWATDPEYTRGRALMLILNLFFAVYFTTRYTFREQLDFLFSMLGFCVLVSTVLAIAAPQYGTMMNIAADAGQVDNWRGVFIHKNVYGPRAGMFLILIFARTLMGSLPLVNAGILGGLTLVSLYKSRSASSLGHTLILILIFGSLYYLAPRLRTLSVGKFVGLVSIVGLFAGIFGVIELDIPAKIKSGALTFTGRVELWEIATEMGLRKPWLGYGYFGFWMPSPDRAEKHKESLEFFLRAEWNPPHSHNGWMEIFLAFGIVGLSILMIDLVSLFCRAVQNLDFTTRGADFRSREDRENFVMAISIFVIFLFCVLNNLTEFNFMRTTNLIWLNYLCMALIIRKCDSKQVSLRTDKSFANSGFGLLSTHQHSKSLI